MWYNLIFKLALKKKCLFFVNSILIRHFILKKNNTYLCRNAHADVSSGMAKVQSYLHLYIAYKPGVAGSIPGFTIKPLLVEPLGVPVI